MGPILESQLSLPLAILLLIAWSFIGFWTRFWSPGIFLGLAWLGAASFFIQSSRGVTKRFFGDMEVLAKNDKEHLKVFLTSSHQLLTSHRFLLFGLPLICGVFVLVGWSHAFSDDRLAILGAVTLGLVFLFAGKGFWGVWAAMIILYKVSRLKLAIDPFYTDGKGGFTVLDDFLEKVGWYFFTGGLLLPMAYEFGQAAALTWVKLLVAAFLVLFFATGIFGTVGGKFLIISLYDAARREAMRESANRMRTLLAAHDPKEEIEEEMRVQASLEKMSRSQQEKYKFLTLLLQILLGAIPLGSYGKGLEKFFKDVLQILSGS